jgi:hypothetical protein
MAHIRRLFRKDAKLQIVAANIRDGESLSLHPNKLVQDVTRAVRAGLQHRFPQDDARPADYLVEFEAVCFGDLPNRAGSPYLLKADAKPEALPPPHPSPDGGGWYTTVTKVEHWLRYVDRATLDALSKRANVPLPFIPMGSSMDPAIIEILKTVGSGEFQPRMGFSIGYPLVWITPRDAFDAVIQGRSDKASDSRDYLGLVHHQTNVHLIALHIPASAVKLVESNRPTFADAGQHRRFLVSCLPASFAHDWGQTLDLAQLEEGSTVASGGAERVAARIQAQHLAGLPLQFDYLGKVRSSRGMGDATDVAFAEQLLGRDKTGFAQVVNRI